MKNAISSKMFMAVKNEVEEFGGYMTIMKVCGDMENAYDVMRK